MAAGPRGSWLRGVGLGDTLLEDGLPQHCAQAAPSPPLCLATLHGSCMLLDVLAACSSVTTNLQQPGTQSEVKRVVPEGQVSGDGPMGVGTIC